MGEVEQTSMRFDSHVHNESHVYLFTHLDFSIAYNGPNVSPPFPLAAPRLDSFASVACARLRSLRST